MSPTGGADTRVCRAETHLGARACRNKKRLDTIVEAADTSVRATSDGPRIFPDFRSSESRRGRHECPRHIGIRDRRFRKYKSREDGPLPYSTG